MKDSDLKCIAITIIITIVTIAVILLNTLSVANAWTVLGTPPPATHTVESGTLKPYASLAGATRYYFINESTVCNAVPTPLRISTTYNIPKTGLFKAYKSPTGVIVRYPVAFDQECKEIVPITPPPPVLIVSDTPPLDAIECATENQTCTIPAGLTANVWYGALNSWVVKEKVLGDIQCSNATFGKDPIAGVSKKCVYKDIVVIPPPPTIPPPIDANCEGKFVCHKEWGWIVQINENQVLQCVAIQISKGTAKTFEGLQVINGVLKCP